MYIGKHKIVDIEKGIVGPTDLAIGGTLTPTQSSKFIDLVVDESPFLKKVHTERMVQLKQELNVLDFAKGSLVRKAEGSEPSDADKKTPQNKGKILSTDPVQLFVDISRQTLLNNKNNPNFQTEMTKILARRFGSDLVYLGFVGVGIDGSSFANLKKGWLYYAENNTDTIKETYTTSTGDTQIKRLNMLVGLIPEDVDDKTAIFMNPVDYRSYLMELGNDTASANVLIEGKVKRFLGFDVIVNNYMPKGKYLATPPENLAFGISGDIYRGRSYHERKRTLEYTYDANVDYQIAVDKYTVSLKAA